MMEKIARFFIDNHKFTLVVMIGFAVFGLSGMSSLKSESFPTVNLGTVIITTVYPGASAEDIEAKITKPIEDEIRSVSGLKDVRSISQAGISRIISVTDIDNYDVEEVVADLQRAVDRTPGLPSDLENPPSFLEVKSEEFPVIELAIVGSNENRKRDKIAYEFKEELEDNKKIASIVTTGYRERQFNILLDREKMNLLHVGLNEVSRKIQAQNVNIPGGNLEKNSTQDLIRIEGKMKSVKELENLVIRSNFSGERILLKDIARVEDGEVDAETLALYNGQPATFLTISKKGGADIIELADEVEEEIKNFSDKYEQQVDFAIFNNEGVRIGKRVEVLSSNGLVGLALVVTFLLIFLPGAVGFMAAMSLPLAVLAAFGYMSVEGMSLNTITILAVVISLGMLVDNAVVISENFARLQRNGIRAKEAAITTVKDLWLPISATAFTTVAAFLPMLVTKGVMGQFIKGIPIVVTAALLFSLIEAFILLPVRLLWAAWFSRLIGKAKPTEEKTDWFHDVVEARFSVFTRWLITHRYAASGIFGGLIFGSVFMMAVVNDFDLFPADQTEIYFARLEMPNGTRIEETQEKVVELSNKISDTLEGHLAHLTGKVGLSEFDFGDPKQRRGENVGSVYIWLTEDAKNSLETEPVLADLRKIEIPGSTQLSFEAMINGPPIGAPVTATFRSNDIKNIDEVVNVVMERLRNTEGVFDVQVNDVYGANELHVEIDQQRAGRLGLDLVSVGSAVRLAIAGERVADVNIDNRDVNYFVRLEGTDRAQRKDLETLRIMDQQGNLIPLAQVATVHEKPASPQVKRFDFKRAKTLTANINKEVITSGDANAIVANAWEGLKKDYKTVSIEWGGEAERTAESMESLAQALILSIIGIFGLLVFLFRSFIRPMIILTTIPLGLIGVAVSFFLHDRVISFLALIGVIGLGGIIVNSGIVLISFIEHMREQNPGRSVLDVLVDATSLRLRAVVVTSLTTVCGLLPTAYGIGGVDEFIIPMTLAMAWGLTSGTILALLWVPCAYMITEDLSYLTKRIFTGRKAARESISNSGTTNASNASEVRL